MPDQVLAFWKELEASPFARWVMAGGAFVISYILFSIARRIAWQRMNVWAKQTPRKWDDLLLENLRAPLRLLIFSLSLAIAGSFVPGSLAAHPVIVIVLKISTILSGLWIFERALVSFVKSDSLPGITTMSAKTLVLTIARLMASILTVLIVLDTVGISITPLLASLGVGSVAVALALQTTLGNFFSGIYLLVDKPMRVGDFVKVNDVEGQIEKIGWRSTRIRLGANNLVVVPNSRIAESQLTNYDFPEREMTFNVAAGVAYGSDLTRVENVALETARDVLKKIPSGPQDSDPVLRFNEFGESSINFQVTLRVREFGDIPLVRHEFIKALHARFASEGIEIPFPQRVVWQAKV